MSHGSLRGVSMAMNINGLNNNVPSPKSTNASIPLTTNSQNTSTKSVDSNSSKPVVPAVTVAIKSAVVEQSKPPAVVEAKVPVSNVVSKPAAAVSKPVVAEAKNSVVKQSLEGEKGNVANLSVTKNSTPATTVSINRPKSEVDSYDKAGNVSKANEVAQSTTSTNLGKSTSSALDL